MINRKNSIPLYHQVKTLILSMISTMNDDDTIPGELELAKRVDVSRGTVKQAIMDLVHEGVLYRVQGKGTFVSPKITRSFSKLPTFTDDITRLGYTAKSKTISFKIVEAKDKILRIFDLPVGSLVYQYKRLVYANDIPIALVISYVRIDMYPDLKLEEIGKSFYETLNKKYQKVPVKADDTYLPMNATYKIAELLNIDEYKSILYSERIAYLATNVPVEFVESYIRGDRFTLNINISPNETNQTNGGDQDVTHIGFRFGNISR